MKTLQDRLVATGFRPSGFDYLRISLAVSVIVWHSISLCYGYNALVTATSGIFRVPYAFVLPLFFALSGFLVAGSLERSRSLPSFLGLRVIRLVPALACEVTLSALLLGPALTALPLGAYFRDPVFAHYFLNIVGDIHYALPGVFAQNPFPSTVNGQLWTVPFELICYLALGVIAVLGIFRNRMVLLWTCVAIQVLYSSMVYLHWNSDAVGHVSGGMLVMSFLGGLLLYRFKDRVPWDVRLFAGAAILCSILFLIPNGDRFVALPVAYVTVYLGLTNPRRSGLLLSGDYSYGMYLYGYPLQQAFVSLGEGTHRWWLVILVVVPAAFLLAAFSWWCIEKPALQLRDTLKVFDRWYVPARDRLLARLQGGLTDMASLFTGSSP